MLAKVCDKISLLLSNKSYIQSFVLWIKFNYALILVN